MLDLINEDIYQNDELKHWGVLGMHWGVRRYQNPDGSLTPEGREHYGVGNAKETKKLSYSKDYMVLKQKKHRTEIENIKLNKLELGKKYLLEDYGLYGKPRKLTKENIEKGKLATDYFFSTNFGKTVTLYTFLGGPFLSSTFIAANEDDFKKELKE